MDVSKKSRLIVEVVKAKNVPKMDIGSESDPFVRIALCGKDKKEHKGRSLHTPSKEDTPNPVWHSFLDFHEYEEGDKLYLKLYDKDVTNDEFIASIYIEISELDYSPKEFPLKKDCSVTLRRVNLPANLVRDVFFIRHGESLWNLAQSEKDYNSLLNYDHPLSPEGIKQAAHLNHSWRNATADSEPLLKTFLASDLIYSSPLTRAAQTCIVGLKTHPHLARHNITLLSSCREVKGLGGLDTVGTAFGDRIEARVLEKLGSEADAEVKAVHFDQYDCTATWWTTEMSENKAHIDHRFEDFLSTLKFSPNQQATIVVGHSLFIKDLCIRYLSDEVKSKKHEISEKLQTLRLSNAGCLYVRFDFSDSPKIIDAQVLFDTTFIK